MVRRGLAITAATVIFVCHSAEAQQSALALACSGTVQSSTQEGDERPVTISMGLIVDLSARTVSGFDTTLHRPASIQFITDTNILFIDWWRTGSGSSNVSGTIDRVTGDVNATNAVYDTGSSIPRHTWTFILKCKPGQRMF
jgi:hypothetical protein